MAETCATCRFWQKDEAISGNGYCRRYPEYIPRASIGWCGEYQLRETELEKPKDREPGWYWVTFEDDRKTTLLEWSGHSWKVPATHFYVGDERFYSIASVRTEPPA